MIREHAFNTRWWGSPVGYVSDPALFYLPDKEQTDALAPYAWAETAMTLDDSISHSAAMSGCGFTQVDTQIIFRINIRRVPDSQSLNDLDVQFAADEAFTIESGALAPFDKERFLCVPGATQELVDRRFELWSNELIENSPEHCMQISYKGEVQGWFLSQTGESKGINLTLAMLSDTASISGMYIYQRALRAYADRGHPLGWASFSAKNSPVHNIYASLGAHFLPPRGNWLWVAPGS